MTETCGPFSLLPQRKTHWSCFATSFGIQALALLLVASLLVLNPEPFTAVKPVFYLTTLVSTPPPQARAAHAPRDLAPVEAPRLIARPTPPPPEEVRPPEFKRPEVPRLELAKAMFVPPPPKIITTGGFPAETQAVPAAPPPAREIQTGGFGDPNGARASGKSGRVLIASLGSFDLPGGPGHGNGTGAARGLRSTVASAGFASGVAAERNTSDTRRGSIQQSGFGDARPTADVSKARRAPQEPVITPVQILFKPVPVYTDEARRLRLEGEVLLEVVFSPEGSIRVRHVLRGLGHGLDEAAIRAAQQIRFRPATRDGHPVESTAPIHVLFQLAY